MKIQIANYNTYLMKNTLWRCVKHYTNENKINIIAEKG